MASSTARKKFVLCLKNDDYPAALEVRKVYVRLEDREAEQEGFLRVVDESGEDYLYPKKYFVAISLPQEAKAVVVGAA